LLNWANKRVDSINQIKDFNDPSINNCKFLFNLLLSIDQYCLENINIPDGYIFLFKETLKMIYNIKLNLFYLLQEKLAHKLIFFIMIFIKYFLYLLG